MEQWTLLYWINLAPENSPNKYLYIDFSIKKLLSFFLSGGGGGD